MTTLFFIYQNAQNQLSAQTVANAVKRGDYLQGLALPDETVKTFRQDRIVEFVDDADQLADRFGYWSTNKASLPRHGHAIEIHFTGFKAADKSALSQRASDAGLVVRHSMSGYLDFLCCGYNASAKKIEQARNQGVLILSEAEFLNLVETGEIPSG